MKRTYFPMHFVFIFPLLVTILVSGTGIALFYNLAYLKDLPRTVSTLKMYLLWSTLFSFLIGLILAYAIIVPFRRLEKMSRNLTRADRAHPIGKKSALDFETEIEEVFQSFEQIDASLTAQRKKELLYRFNSLALLTAGVAHELRNPLGSIKGLTNLIDEDLAEGDAKKEYTRVILREISRLEETINRFLSLTPSRAKDAQPEEIDINSLLDETISLLGFNPLAKGIQVIKDIQPIKVLGFREKLRQAFLNIILNAYQAMPEGGILRITAKKLDSATVEVTFQDTGIGIAEEDVDKVFEPFFTTKDNSSGLGLTIVNQIISDHQGEIKVESKRGEGSRFIITFPREKNG